MASDESGTDLLERPAPSSGGMRASKPASKPPVRTAGTVRDADTLAKYRAGKTIAFDELKRRVLGR